MLRRNVVGAWAGVVLAGVAGAACSSSSGSATPDSGADGSGKTGKDGGVDAARDGAADGGKKGQEGGSDAATGAVTARFKLTTGTVPNLLDVPFPSDIYLTSTGTIVDPLPGADAVITANSKFITHELARLNGFSRVAQSLFWVDDPAETGGIATLDPTSLPVSEAECVADKSSVFLIDLSATGAAARVPCRAAFHDDRAFGTTGYRPALAVGPGRGVVLEEGHQYATVLTSRVKTMKGAKVEASADFLALSGPSMKTTLYGKALGTAETVLASALASDGATIVGLAPFTTSSSTKTLLQMRTNLEKVAVPTLAWDATSLKPMGSTKFAAKVGGVLPTGFTASLDDYLGTVTAPALTDGSDDPNADLPVRAHNRIAAVGTAVFQAQNYLSPAGVYNAVGAATFSYDANGNVIPDATKPTAPIWVTFFVPTAAMPANGYPVVIVQHGLGESRMNEAFNLANTFANAGWVVAAIDSVTFGARATEAQYEVDLVNNFASGGGAYSGPDGLADPIGSPPATNGINDIFGYLLDLGAMRDQFRQAEIDTSQLARVLASSPALTALQTGATVPKIDGTKIAYFGNSLGGMQGAAAAAIEPLIKSWVLNVAGGGVITELAAHSPRVAFDVSFAGTNFGGGSDHLTESHPLMNLLQTLFDPGDPINYAPYVVKSPATVNGAVLPPKNVLQIEVVYDEFVPNEANEALARALGLGLATPNVGTNSGVNSLAMVKDPTSIPDRLPLADVNPDTGGLIHDTPMAGTTSVLVQAMPAIHGQNFQAGVQQHVFAIPYDQFSTATPFVTLKPDAGDPPFNVTASYQKLQGMAVRFLTDAFAGDVPNVTGFPAPVRDFDGDGAPDSTDKDPNNPNIQ